MKNANQIISHLKTQPYFKNLTKSECFDKLLSLLPRNISLYVKFLYIKNNTLFFVLSHPGIKMEFNYKRNLIKSILNKLLEVDSNCSFMETKEIKAFVSNRENNQIDNFLKNSSVTFSERSSGNFKIKTDNPTLKNLFEEIQNSIKSNIDKSC